MTITPPPPEQNTQRKPKQYGEDGQKQYTLHTGGGGGARLERPTLGIRRANAELKHVSCTLSVSVALTSATGEQ